MLAPIIVDMGIQKLSDPKTVSDLKQEIDKTPTCLGQGPHTRACYHECVMWRECLRLKDKGGREDSSPRS